MDGMKAYKMSLALDCVSIFIAVAVLYCANNNVLPVWALVAGAVVALVFLIAAIMQLRKARRIFKQEAEVMMKENQAGAQEEKDGEV